MYPVSIPLVLSLVLLSAPVVSYLLGIVVNSLGSHSGFSFRTDPALAEARFVTWPGRDSSDWGPGDNFQLPKFKSGLYSKIMTFVVLFIFVHVCQMPLHYL
jgi:hypothetical protein